MAMMDENVKLSCTSDFERFYVKLIMPLPSVYSEIEATWFLAS